MAIASTIMVSTTSLAGRMSWISPTPCPASQGISSQSPSVSSVARIRLNLPQCDLLAEEYRPPDHREIVADDRHLCEAIGPFIDHAVPQDPHWIKMWPFMPPARG